jgi:hypothetical protein
VRELSRSRSECVSVIAVVRLAATAGERINCGGVIYSGLLGVAAVMLSCGFCSELLALNFMTAGAPASISVGRIGEPQHGALLQSQRSA